MSTPIVATVYLANGAIYDAAEFEDNGTRVRVRGWVRRGSSRTYRERDQLTRRLSWRVIDRIDEHRPETT